NKTNSLESIMESLSAGDQVIIYDLTNLYRTLSELASIFRQAKQKEIKLIILNKEEIFNNMTDEEFIEFIFDLNEENKRVTIERKKRSSKGVNNVGRPKLSKESIEKIRHLRLEKNYSLRDTAELCGVSIGTVHKYADKAGE
ncbi:recombinase family protein, partial [Acinetobacter baumannii]|uniref:recombinase family protein n=1 Tax=Acinetobacter baumannii TaxID=470 RepID=UPI001AED0409